MHLAELNEEGEMLELASADGALLLFGHAEAINAPVVSHGPFVMNTREEIVEAINDYQAGKFGAPRS
jgi:redox-sensitive bicupin YhaK (pirin superfamily)